MSVCLLFASLQCNLYLTLCLFSAICQHSLQVNLLWLISGLGTENIVSIYLGTYKSEENQLLLKVYQVKGPTEHYYSKFKNDNWAMDGYVRQTILFFFINIKTMQSPHCVYF